MEKTVLIIDDNREIRENMSELLELAGYKIFTANDGKTGLESAKTNKPDIILCDVMMPELDGYGVLRAFENIHELEGIPFVFITSKSETSDFRFGMELGADDYLTKPFTGDELLRVVAARIKKSRIVSKKIESKLEAPLLNQYDANLNQRIESLSTNRTIKKVRKKDIIYMEGDTTNFLHYIISGKIKVYKSNELGKEYITNIYKEKDFLSYTALLEDGEYKESAVAMEDTEMALIPKDDFFQILYSNSEIALSFVKLISRNFSDAGDKLLKLAYDSARKRVAEAIVYASKMYQEDGNGELSFSLLRENISALSGISPESVSRNLTDFKLEGLIETSNGIIKIINLKKLENIKN